MNVFDHFVGLALKGLNGRNNAIMKLSIKVQQKKNTTGTSKLSPEYYRISQRNIHMSVYYNLSPLHALKRLTHSVPISLCNSMQTPNHSNTRKYAERIRVTQLTLEQGLIFVVSTHSEREVAGKEGVIFSRLSGVQFLHKNKLKYEIFHDKKVVKQK